MVEQVVITLAERPRGFHLITRDIVKNLPPLPEKGLLHLLLQHTSAALALNENADPSVRHDFEQFMNRLVAEKQPFFTHTLEGADDMPAHIKSTLMGQSLCIPITHRQLNLGTWQGIYLCEFRHHGGPRTIVATIVG